MSHIISFPHQTPRAAVAATRFTDAVPQLATGLLAQPLRPDDLAQLEPAVQEAIAAEARHHAQVVVHLPLERTRYRGRVNHLPVATGDGHVHLREGERPDHAALLENVRRMLLVALSGAPTDWTQAHTFAAESDAGLLGVWFPVWDHYGLPEAAQWLDGRTGDVSWRLSVSLPGEAARPWLVTSSERAVGFHRIATRLGLAVQEWGRLWLPALSCSDPRWLEYPLSAHSLLAYASTRIHQGKTRDEVGYDALSEDGLNRALASAKSALPDWLEWARQLAGPRWEQHYDARRLPFILEAIRRSPRFYQRLVLGDLRLTDELLGLAARGSRLLAQWERDPQGAASGACRFAEDFAASFTKRLRLIGVGEQIRDAGLFLLIEATRAMNEGAQPLRTAIELTHAGETARFTAEIGCVHAIGSVHELGSGQQLRAA